MVKDRGYNPKMGSGKLRHVGNRFSVLLNYVLGFF